MGEGNSCVGQARVDIANIVNQHTQNLSDYQERGLPWNIERRQIVIEARDGTEELSKVRLACPDAKYDVTQGVRLLMENAKSAYKDTLYLHETFSEDDFWKNYYKTGEKRGIDNAFLLALALWSLDPKRISFVRGLSVIGIAYSIVDNLYQAGSFIYMKATNPDLQFMAVEE